MNIQMNKYIIYYIEEPTNKDSSKRYYKFCKYKDDDKLTIQNINKEINRQIKNSKNGKFVNSNYEELVELFSNKSFIINIYGGCNQEKVDREYNRFITLPQYKLRPKPKLKRGIYDNSWTEDMIQKDYKYRIQSWEDTNKEKIEKMRILKNRLIDRYSKEKFIEGDLNKIKNHFNNFIEKNKTLNKKKENIKSNPNEKIKCECGMYYTRTNKSHHFKKHHNKKCLIIDI
jgi:hypothetical protein